MEGIHVFLPCGCDKKLNLCLCMFWKVASYLYLDFMIQFLCWLNHKESYFTCFIYIHVKHTDTCILGVFLMMKWGGGQSCLFEHNFLWNGFRLWEINAQERQRDMDLWVLLIPLILQLLLKKWMVCSLISFILIPFFLHTYYFLYFAPHFF